MKLLKENFRIWWQKPASVLDRNTQREITQLELFYDLIYVAIIIQLTHVVAGHISIESIFQYLAIFLMTLWAWFNGSLYHEFHGNNDIKTRVSTFFQMIALAGMGIFIHSAFGDGYQGFALSYSIFLLLLTLLWWRTGVHDPDHRPLSNNYVRGFAISTVAFFVSVFLPAEIARAVWLVTIIFSVSYSLLTFVYPSKKAKPEQVQAIRTIGYSFVERIGLLTIIILGEGVISTISGAVSIDTWHIVNMLQVIGCFGILIGIWWIFFDFISRRLPKPSNRAKFFWVVLHLPLMVSIGLVNAGILNILKYSDHFIGPDRWIFTFPLMIFFLSSIVLGKTIQLPEIVKLGYKNATRMMFISIFALGVISFLPTGTTLTIWLIVATFALPVLAALLSWLATNSQNKNTSI